MPVTQKLSRSELQQKKKGAETFCVQVLFTLHHLRRYIQHASSLLTTIDHPDLVHSDPKLDELLVNYRKNLRENIFPEALYYSFVILLYGIIENSLKQTCDLIHEMKKTPMRAKDLSGDTLSQCMAFLYKLGGVPNDSIKSLSQIRDLAKVRNCIVHASGFIERINDGDKKRIHQLAANSPDLIELRTDTNPDDTKLVLSLKYCSTSVKHAFDFFEEVFRARHLLPTEGLKQFKALSKVL